MKIVMISLQVLVDEGLIPNKGNSLNLLKRGEIFGGHSASDATGTMSNPFSEHRSSSPAVLGLIRNSPGNAYITEWKDG